MAVRQASTVDFKWVRGRVGHCGLTSGRQVRSQACGARVLRVGVCKGGLGGGGPTRFSLFVNFSTTPPQPHERQQIAARRAARVGDPHASAEDKCFQRTLASNFFSHISSHISLISRFGRLFGLRLPHITLPCERRHPAGDMDVPRPPCGVSRLVFFCLGPVLISLCPRCCRASPPGGDVNCSSCRFLGQEVTALVELGKTSRPP